jgi:ubiquinone/menaquinone biosynthesis C-methylase UbiE
MLDLGGGPGTNAMAMAKKGVQATIFDLPETTAIARKVARREGVRELRFVAGDFHFDSIGSGYDLILISQIFHAFSGEENVALLLKCRQALNPGGRVAVQEFPIDETRTAPPQRSLLSEYARGHRKGALLRYARNEAVADRDRVQEYRRKETPETILIEGKAISK